MADDLLQVVWHVFHHDTSFDKTVEVVWSPNVQKSYYVLVLEVLENPDLAQGPTAHEGVAEVSSHFDRNFFPRASLFRMINNAVRTATYASMYVVVFQQVIRSSKLRMT